MDKKIYYTPRPREIALEHIEAYILNNKLKPGDKLPPERQMCQMWELNRSTLRSALSYLINSGRLYSIQGSGIRIAPRLERTLLDLKGFSEHASIHSHKLETRLLFFSVIECDKHLSMHFKLMLGEKVYKMIRLRIVDDIPAIIETSYIPQSLVPGLEQHDFVKGSLFSTLKNVYKLKLDHGEEKASITSATEEEAEILNIEAGSPAIWLVSTTKDIKDTTIEYCRTIARADLIDMVSTLYWQHQEKNSNE